MQKKWMNKNEKKAFRAIDKISNQQELFDIVMYNYDTRRSLYALERIADDSLLKGIALRKLDNYTIFIKSYNKITDDYDREEIQKTIVQHLININSFHLFHVKDRKYLVERIKNQDLLYQLALEGIYSKDQLDAAKQIVDLGQRQKALAAIAREHGNVCNSQAGREALELLDDSMRKLILREFKEQEKQAIVKRNKDKQEQKRQLTTLTQEQLASIVYDNWLTEHEHAMDALDLITDQSILKEMSYWRNAVTFGKDVSVSVGAGVLHPLWDVACSKITDRNVLHELITTANVSVTAYNARKRLHELDEK